MSSNGDEDPRVNGIKTKIRVVPNFPKPGIMFQDITTLLLDPKAFKDTVDLFIERYKGKNISAVAGEVISEEYVLEYGRDCLEMHVGAVEKGERALVVDDLIATGGTLRAAMNLLERAGAEVVECACLIELPELKGRERLQEKPLYVLVEYH
ncbi:Adenine phosphoribosyltransferase 4 [Linum perenne]